MARPFQPASTVEQVPVQLRNLHAKLARLQSIRQLDGSVTSAQVAAKLNEVISALNAITVAGPGPATKNPTVS